MSVTVNVAMGAVFLALGAAMRQQKDADRKTRTGGALFMVASSLFFIAAAITAFK